MLKRHKYKIDSHDSKVLKETCLLNWFNHFICFQEIYIL